jgi:hypothetical protein
MKFRTGFVSNSSSSSFVIAKAYLNTEQMKGLRAGLKAITMSDNMDPDDDCLDEGWGDSGRTWEEQGEYFFIEYNYVYEQISDLFKKLKINWKDGFTNEG